MENSAFDDAKVETTGDAMECKVDGRCNRKSDAYSSFSMIAAQQTLVYASQTEGVTLFEIGLS